MTGGRYPLAADRRHWPAEWREEAEEREAILIFDAKMDPERARRAADHIVRERYENGRKAMETVR